MIICTFSLLKCTHPVNFSNCKLLYMQFFNPFRNWFGEPEREPVPAAAPVWDHSSDRCQARTEAGHQCPWSVADGRYRYCNVHGQSSTPSTRWDHSSDRCQARTEAGHQCPWGVAQGRYKYCNVHGHSSSSNARAYLF